MSSKSSDSTSRGQRISGLIMLCLSVLTFISLVFFHPFDFPASDHPEEILNPLKHFGAVTAYFLINFTFGRWGSFVFPVIMILWGFKLLIGRGRLILNSLKLIGLGVITGWFLHLITKSTENLLPEYHYGLISGAIARFFENFTGMIGAWIITIVAILALVEVTIGLKQPAKILLLCKYLYQKLTDLVKNIKAKRAKSKLLKAGSKREEVPPKKPASKLPKSAAESKPAVKEKSRVVEIADEDSAESEPSDQEEVYTFPSSDILTKPVNGEEASDEELRTSAASLEARLAEFGVEAQVVAIHPGPVITRFDLQPAPGVKVSRIVALQDDLSLSMRARSLRIMAPIPGEAAVGIEVPNKHIQMVHLRKIIESDAYINSKSKLAMALGVDTSGNPFVACLDDMPHLLVAGTTGSGKSVCLNTILASFLFRTTPEEVRLALIDPKKLELKLYVPLLEHHLITPPGLKEPVVTEPDNALKMLKSLELEMQVRYNKLSERGSRNLEEYNENRENTRLPYIVLVIDELADLMMTAGGAIETPIARLAQMGRAVGIHLIVATQRPSVDVITGLIKANFPCRIAFQVASKVDSRTIIDANGAETLLGKGDMLFLPPGVSAPIRIHGSFITTREIEAIVNHVSRQPVIEELVELPDPLEESPRGIDLSPGSRDELFEQAAKLIAVHQQGSVSLLQRKLKIGYARAARIIDQLEAAGIVGPFDGSKARKVMVAETWLPEMGYGSNSESEEAF